MSETIYFKQEEYSFVDVNTGDKVLITYEEYHNPRIRYAIDVSVSTYVDRKHHIVMQREFELLRRDEAKSLFNRLVADNQLIAEDNPNQSIVYNSSESTTLKKGIKDE